MKELKVYTILPGGLYQRGKLIRYSLDRKLHFIEIMNIDIIIGLAGGIDVDLKDIDISGIIDYHYFHMADGKMTEHIISHIEKLANYAADAYTNHRKKILVYCNAGRNRSGLLNALIVRNVLHISGIDALNYVRNCRPKAIANDHFVKFLENLS